MSEQNDIEVQTTEPLEAVEREFPNVRAAVALPGGRIDCEIEHPDYGWIPTTVDPAEDEEFFDYIVAELEIADYEPPENWREEYQISIRNALEGTVLALAGNPGQAEIASWPNKIEAARRIVSGDSSAEIILAPTVARFGVDMAGAAQIVLLRSRLYELAKVVAETMEATTLAALEAATPETVQALLDGLQEQIDTRTAEFVGIRGAAITGDMSFIQAAEQQFLDG